MGIVFVLLIALGAIGGSSAEAQFGNEYGPFRYGLGYPTGQHFPGPNYFPNYPYPNGYPNMNDLFREKSPFESSAGLQPFGYEHDERFGTLTWTWATTTTTTTFTSSTTCSTSTAALKVCTPSGGRRRRMVELSRKGRGIFYSEDDDAGEDTIFLPATTNQTVTSSGIDGSIRVRREDPLIPFEIPPGLDVPEELGTTARFWVQLGTSTSTKTTTSTYTYSLTATCASTTGYQVCGSSGKR